MTYYFDVKEKNAVLQYFDSFSSLASVDASEINLSSWRATIARHTGSPTEAQSWYGMEVPELRAVSEIHGWSEGSVRGENILGHLKAPILQGIKRKRCKGAIGNSLNPLAMLNGNFDRAWATTKKLATSAVKKRSGNVNVVIDVGGNCSTGADAFFWRGAVGTMLARALQKSGRNVRILCGSRTRGLFLHGNKQYCCVVECKPFGAMLNLDRLFSMTALAGFFRYYIFKVFCSQNKLVNSAFGSTVSLQPEFLEPLVDGSPLIIVSDIWNERSAINVCNTLLERFK